MKKLIDFIYKTPITKFLSASLMIAMALVMTMNVILRKFFLFSFNWSDEIMRYMAVYCGFLAIAAGWRWGKHISITVVTEHLVPEKARKFFRLFSDISAIIFMAFLTYYGIELIQRIMRTGQASAAMQIPMWIVYGIAPVCGIISIIHILLTIFKGKTYLEPRE